MFSEWNLLMPEPYNKRKLSFLKELNIRNTTEKKSKHWAKFNHIFMREAIWQAGAELWSGSSGLACWAKAFKELKFSFAPKVSLADF